MHSPWYFRPAWLVAAALAGCATGLAEHEDVVVTGSVVDAATGDPLGNVKVSTDRLEVFSDFDGSFALEGRMFEPDWVRLTLSKSGYAVLVTDVEVAANHTEIGVVALQPKAP